MAQGATNLVPSYCSSQARGDTAHLRGSHGDAFEAVNVAIRAALHLLHHPKRSLPAGKRRQKQRQRDAPASWFPGR
jgi:hypothetical protein